MKCMFYFNWEFSLLCHALAVRLKASYGFEDKDFCGLVVQNKDYTFLSSQKQIRYSKLGTLSEFMDPKEVLSKPIDLQYIKKMEETYGIPNLWPYVYADRTLITYNAYVEYTHEDYLKFLQSAFKYVVSFIEHNKPDVLFCDPAASLPSYILYHVAKKHGVQIVIPTFARCGNRILFSSDPIIGFDRALKSYSQGSVSPEGKEAAREYLQRFRKQAIEPEYIRTSRLGIKKYFSLKAQVAKIPRFFEYLYHYHAGDYAHDYVYYKRTVGRAGMERLKQHMNRLLDPNKSLFEQPRYNEEYVFFPLHYDPEMATMVMGLPYVNQIFLIENIAKSLPVTYKLYVKDHPVMALEGRRESSYYKQLKKIPNVRLINPLVPSHELISKSKAVTTITGTAGWEALLLRKPVITFGNVFYNHSKLVRKCTGFEQLPVLINSVLASHEYDEDDMVSFLGAIFDHSFDIRMSELYGQAVPTPFSEVLAHPDLKVLVDRFAQEVGLDGSKKRNTRFA